MTSIPLESTVDSVSGDVRPEVETVVRRAIAGRAEFRALAVESPKLSSGQTDYLFASHDDGDSWKLIEGSLPEICCVKAYMS